MALKTVYSVEDYGAVHDGVTNDTAAIQSAIQACFDGGGGTVYFPKGTYLLSSAKDSSSGAQLYIPLNSFSDTTALKRIKLQGEIGPNMYGNPFTSAGSNSYPRTGVILKSTLLTTADVIGARYETVSWGDFNFVHLEIENIMVIVGSKSGATDVTPVCTGINASRIAFFQADNVGVMPESDQDDVVQPTATAYGFRLPAINNWVISTLKQCYAYGMYVGFELSEHARVLNSFVDVCYVGVLIGPSHHSIHVDSLCIARCRTNIKVTSATSFRFDNVSFEEDPQKSIPTPTWNTTTYDIEETGSGNSEGTIYYHRVRANYGTEFDYLVRSKQTDSNIFAIHVGQQIPVWDTALRPSTIKRLGITGYNTTTGTTQTWDGASWKDHYTSSVVSLPSTANLLIHFDADDYSSLTMDSSNRVSQMNDKSGNSYHVSNAGAATTWPTRVPFYKNGRAALRFVSSSSQILSRAKITALQGINGLTVFIVGGLGGGERFYHGFNNSNRTEFLNNLNGDSDAYAIICNAGSSYGQYNNTTQTLYKGVYIYDGTQSTNATKLVCKINGTTQSLTFTGTIPSTTEAHASSIFTIGGKFNSPGYDYSNGYLCEMLVYTRALTSQEVTDIESYLSSKWLL